VVVQYFTPGVYYVRLTVGNDNGSSTFTQENAVIVYDTPEADFDFSINQAVVDFEYTGNLVESYKWSFGDGGESNEKNPRHTYAEDGVYEVILTVTNACGTHVVIDTVIISRTSVSDLGNLQFQIVPNPTTGLVKIAVNNATLNGQKTIEILSTEGKKLNNFQLRGSEKELWIDLNDLPAGLYFVKIQDEKQFGIKKLVKQ
jgi:PKD repeat protein